MGLQNSLIAGAIVNVVCMSEKWKILQSRKASLTVKGGPRGHFCWLLPLESIADWSNIGSRTAMEKDVITCFTYAAVKAAERKDAARCQVEPAGKAAWHTVVWCQPHLGPRRRRAPQGTPRSPGYSTSRSCPSPPPFTSDCGKTLQMERHAMRCTLHWLRCEGQRIQRHTNSIWSSMLGRVTSTIVVKQRISESRPQSPGHTCTVCVSR